FPSDARPIIKLAFARDHSRKGKTPRLARSVQESKRAKWNLHDNNKSLRGQFAGGIPDCVPRQVIALFFGKNQILLYAVRVRDEAICAPLIVEGVNEYPDFVVRINEFPAGHTRPDSFR